MAGSRCHRTRLTGGKGGTRPPERRPHRQIPAPQVSLLAYPSECLGVLTECAALVSTPPGIEYRTPTFLNSPPSFHSAQDPLSSGGAIPELRSAASPSGFEPDSLSPSVGANGLDQPGQQDAWTGDPQRESSRSGALPLQPESRGDTFMGAIGPVIHGASDDKTDLDRICFLPGGAPFSFAAPPVDFPKSSSTTRTQEGVLFALQASGDQGDSVSSDSLPSAFESVTSVPGMTHAKHVPSCGRGWNAIWKARYFAFPSVFAHGLRT